MKKEIEFQAGKFAVYGTLFGLCFPVGATLIDIYLNVLPLAFSSIIQVQTANPLHWIIDSAPLWLGLFAWLGGINRDKVSTYAKVLKEQLVEKEADLDQTLNALNEKSEEIKNLQIQLKAANNTLKKTEDKIKNDHTLDVKELALETIKQQLQAREYDLKSVKKDLQAKTIELHNAMRLQTFQEREVGKLKREINNLQKDNGLPDKYDL
ncbi:MAG: hypothetical protein HQK83_01750 [Fibrobacteria bacterium]|nr:hypothetical protein [Fibrobacteria bacterium]